MRRLAVALMVAAVLACGGDGGPTSTGPTNAMSITLTLSGLRTLDGSEGTYAVWLVPPGGQPRVLGQFNGGTAATLPLAESVTNGSEVWITLEPPGDKDLLPSAQRILRGSLVNGRAELSVVGAITQSTLQLRVRPGQFTMFSPSDNALNGYPSHEESGVWLFNMQPAATDQRDMWVRLSQLESGWTYEGWMVRDMNSASPIWLSYGKFLPDNTGAINSRDDSGWGAFSGVVNFRTDGEEEFPGDDWIANPLSLPFPRDLTLPLNLREKDASGVGRWTHVITIEPATNRGESIGSERPFLVRPYVDPFGDGAPGIPRSITFHAENVPRRPRRVAMKRFTVGALVATATFLLSCGDSITGPLVDERDAGTWKTWVLSSGAEIVAPAAPANESAQTTSEVNEIVALQSAHSASTDSIIQRWNALPTSPWHMVTLERLEFYWALLPDVRHATPVRSARILSLVNVAMYDAMVAAYHAKALNTRRAPFLVDRRIRPLLSVDGSSTYPSEHAAVAAAAARVLTFLLPMDDTTRFQRLAREAGDARLAAGVAYRSDVDAGYAIGRAVAERVIAHARADGSDATWNGGIPVESYAWRPTPPKRVKVPFDALAGTWSTWTIPAGNVYRPSPPPLPGSARFDADLKELRQIGSTRTTAQADTARYWATDAPSSRWEVFMDEEISARKLGPMHAARALALASTAMSDAMIACWDAKFYYWLERPISADTTLRTAISTPPFPSYPSGHSTQSAAAAEIFAYLFPDRAEYYRRKADEASHSRVLAGIHYRFDVEAGEELGREVGAAAVARARTDGAR